MLVPDTIRQEVYIHVQWDSAKQEFLLSGAYLNLPSRRPFIRRTVLLAVIEGFYCS